jgi:hypothetical protein
MIFVFVEPLASTDNQSCGFPMAGPPDPEGAQGDLHYDIRLHPIWGFAQPITVLYVPEGAHDIALDLVIANPRDPLPNTTVQAPSRKQ